MPLHSWKRCNGTNVRDDGSGISALAIVTLLMGALPTGSGFGEPDLGVVAWQLKRM